MFKAKTVNNMALKKKSSACYSTVATPATSKSKGQFLAW